MDKARKKLDLSKYMALIALIVLVVLITFLNPQFIAPSNLMNLLRQSSINCLIAFGMTFVILTGGIDLSVGSVLAFTGAVAATLILSGTPVWLACIACLVLGAILGGVNGFLISYGKVTAFIATLATMTIWRGATYVFTGGNPITGPNMNNSFFFQFIGNGYLFGIPFPVIITLLIFAAVYILLHKTAFGRKTFALGGNEKAAFVAGVKTKKIIVLIYIISGVLAALAALILTSRLSSAQPDAGSAYEMDAIASAVIGGASLMGGKGRMQGTLVGALLIATLSNGMNLLGINSFYQQIVKGLVILVAVMIDSQSQKKNG
ncbi:ribose ABC transporter permease [Lactobacillus mulieris]|uniref:Ribose ABC transporter permease n=2 Tax=Lactobacillus mulieris TaxID=2508708 RepID=A0AAW5WXI6_9LACO|nr:ribose ABC transporter permease [Lactobacillus mulieris]MCZ3621709.1 ribose ABC transporter permease [Lactobacillus mulieris]MCZ3623015.1 ribose ABC transporter permease [Lactobacillus mulieris]MCZ3635716.1 ribose ABC transporter permease [Lactobacillus mulieris]MCZ3690115.1 ribose ABC transporter permease [Lactobacillus mulieris]MCZ3696502.1 ribose ABC transporter permease [Lactobacillus mulieris]